MADDQFLWKNISSVQPLQIDQGLHRLCSDRVVKWPRVEEKHWGCGAEGEDVDYQAHTRAKRPASVRQRFSEEATPDKAADCDVV